LIFGVLDIINIAQGILVVLAAHQLRALRAPAPGSLHRPAGDDPGDVRRRGRHPGPVHTAPRPRRTSMSLLASYAVMIIIEGILYLSFGPDYVSLNARYVTSTIRVFGFYLPYIYLFGFGLAVALVLGLYYMLYRTKFGRSLRATMQDQVAARLIGIDVNRVAALAFGIGVAVTAVGGMVFGATNAFNPNSGYDLISRLLAIIILGGLGSIGGAMAAAIFMTTVESLVNIWSPTWSVVVFYAALVIVLTFRPEGMFGRPAVRAQ
jgi:branched-chain amino acid transport system permease protein